MLTNTGLRIPETLAFEDWERAGHRLSGMADLTSWCLGDWLVYGMNNYADRYRQAIEALGLSYQTLRNYAWVARQFSNERRRSGLSFQHHAEVASLSPEQQDYWLTRAAESAWTTKRLRTAIRDERRSRTTIDNPDTTVSRLTVRGGHVDRWQEAAQRSGRDFEAWVVESLNHAAARTLDVTET
ncbi:LmbU family transcriptional regulator [Lentzea sp. DG1S-22]|uniref:LmbU family transcriptional regulator n=1 Tax=Lentzea sp. DG1S-22 TaxID=3108822 RepID=UPI002E75C4D3|nr:LmbU family transcriptional regulator [Lentzea sp. DG1S-22]WVH84825.1 LmbU family transcriptional regulator [Lentzea sp. DG1S-22]